jgi:hypothetical protein
MTHKLFKATMGQYLSQLHHAEIQADARRVSATVVDDEIILDRANPAHRAFARQWGFPFPDDDD